MKAEKEDRIGPGPSLVLPLPLSLSIVTTNNHTTVEKGRAKTNQPTSQHLKISTSRAHRSTFYILWPFELPAKLR
jgi:hypothetical protein